MDWYQQWLDEERKWIGKYQNKIIATSILKVVPATLIGLCVIYGGITYVEEKNVGIVISGIYLLILLAGLRPGKYVGMINLAVKRITHGCSGKGTACS